MAEIDYTEPICPKCKKETMKEWVTHYKCRNLNCRLKLNKKFPPDPGNVKNYERIKYLERELKDCERRLGIQEQINEYDREVP